MPELNNVVEQCINKLVSNFKADPFRYSVERDIHFELQEQLKGEDPSWQGNVRGHQEWRGQEKKL